jgi:hypothetical protein
VLTPLTNPNYMLVIIFASGHISTNTLPISK